MKRKRFAALALSAVMALSLAACGEAKTNVDNGGNSKEPVNSVVSTDDKADDSSEVTGVPSYKQYLFGRYQRMEILWAEHGFIYWSHYVCGCRAL